MSWNSTTEHIFTIGMYVVSFLMGGTLVFVTKFKKFLKEYRESKGVENNFIRIHSEIDEFLSELRIKLNGCRAAIVKFHNGGYFFDSTSIMKFTTTHESCKVGVESSMDRPQGHLITRFMEMMELLQNDNSGTIYTLDLKESHFKAFLESKGTIAFSFLPLKNEKGLKIGYLICEWCSFDQIEGIPQEEVDMRMAYYRRVLNSLISKNE
jgi:hypothetical protein